MRILNCATLITFPEKFVVSYVLTSSETTPTRSSARSWR